MARVVEYIVTDKDITDPRAGLKRMRESVVIKTDLPVSWTWLRKQSQLPAEGAVHGVESGMYCESRNPKQRSRLVWDLETNWTSVQIPTLESSPASRPAVITFSSSSIEVPAYLDRLKRPITNTAAQFLPGVVRRIPIVEYKIKKNVTSDPAWLDTHLESINSDAVTIRGKTRAAKTLALTGCSGGEYKVENNQRHCEIELTVLFNPLGWVEDYFNVGTKQLALVKKRFIDSSGVVQYSTELDQVPIMTGSPRKPTEEAVPLDLNGVPLVGHLSQGTQHPIDVSKIVKIKIEVQKQLNYSGILPLS